MVLNLAEIFRYFLQSDRTFVPLAQEMQIVRAYLEIEQLRLGDRLKVEFHMDEAALDVPVPVLSVQPLVENAIKHGIAPQPEGGALQIELTRTPTGLLLRVANGGRPLKAEYQSGTGLGNLKERLELLPAPRPVLRLETEGAWTVAQLELPWRWPA